MILDEPALTVLRGILREQVPGREIYLVGSRATGEASRFSDIDLLVAGEDPLAPSQRAALRMALEESDLPYQTDLIEEATLSSERRATFRRQAQRLL